MAWGKHHGDASMITEEDATLRINAMACEFREIIASISQRCAELAVSNALANKIINEKEESIGKLKKELGRLQEMSLPQT